MKYTTALIALATAVSAQDLSLLPTCALPCIVSAVPGATDCANPTDFECVCGSMEAVKEAAMACVIEECGEDVANNEVLPATEEFCAPFAGGDDDTPAPTTSEETPAPTTTAEEDDTPAPTTTAAEEPTETPGEGDDGEDDGDDTVPTPSGSDVVPTPTDGGEEPEPTATDPVETAGAARVMGGLGMVLLGAVAAL